MQTVKKRLSVHALVITSLMIALTIVLMVTPLGTIKLPMVSITIAHIPAMITALAVGLEEGLTVALALGVSSLCMAAFAPGTILDPFFVNPLISVLPRLCIPVTTYFSYKAIRKGIKPGAGEQAAIGVAAVIGNLTNTFGVFFMLYLLYARQILQKTGSAAFHLIVAALSITTAVKCVAVVILVLPIVYALRRAEARM